MHYIQGIVLEQLSLLIKSHKILLHNNNHIKSKYSLHKDILVVSLKLFHIGVILINVTWNSLYSYQVITSKTKEDHLILYYISLLDYPLIMKMHHLKVTSVHMPLNTKSVLSSQILVPETLTYQDSKIIGISVILQDTT